MANASFLICDHCKAEGHNGGVGKEDICNVSIITETPGKEYFDADLCSTCREELQTYLNKYLRRAV